MRKHVWKYNILFRVVSGFSGILVLKTLWEQREKNGFRHVSFSYDYLCIICTIFVLSVQSNKMDNALRRTIRKEIADFMNGQSLSNQHSELDQPSTSVPSANNQPQSVSQPKGLKREQRLTSLLSRIRGHKDGKEAKKTKKLCIKYERFDEEQQVFVNVRTKDGGGIRYIDLPVNEAVPFRSVEQDAISFFFDNKSCNSFYENLSDCLFNIVSVAGEIMDPEESVWSFLKRKGLCLSKSVFILQSTHVILPPITWNLEEPNVASNLGGEKRSLCQVCSCTYLGDTCITCEQNEAYDRSLLNDAPSTFLQTEALMAFNDDSDEITRPSPQELRQIRLDNFSVASRQLVVKVKRSHLKGDLMMQFKTLEVCEKLILY